MTNSITVRNNLPEFKRELLALGQRIERNIARAALRASAKVVADEANRIAPVLAKPILGRKRRRIPGALRNSIRVIGSRRSKRGLPAYALWVRATSKQAENGVDPFYWRFLEAGWIPRGPGNRFKGGKRRRAVERERALASGAQKITKYRFFEPAFKSKQAAAIDAFVKRVETGIAKENQKRIK